MMSEEEKAFTDAVNNLGEVNADSYEAIEEAYSLFTKIDVERQQQMSKGDADSFKSLKQANIQLFNSLADEIPDSFNSYLDVNGGDWSKTMVKENIPDDVLEEFCTNDYYRDILKKADTAHGWLTDEMYTRSNIFEYSDQCDQTKYFKILKYSSVIRYWDDDHSNKSNSSNGSGSSSSSSDDDWAKEILEEQFGTSDPDEVERRGQWYKQKGDDFYDRYGYYPRG